MVRIFVRKENQGDGICYHAQSCARPVILSRNAKVFKYRYRDAKRFMAYEIIKRLEADKNVTLLEDLYHSVKKGERKKGQRHKVFADSFDSKECYSNEFVYQKLAISK